MMNEVPSDKKFGLTPQISKNFRSGSILIRKSFETTWWLLWCNRMHRDKLPWAPLAADAGAAEIEVCLQVYHVY